MTPERFTMAVLGPGGVGGFLAAMMAREGSSVLMLASDETSRAIAQNGLHLESGTFGSFAATVRTATSLSEPVNACIVAVKATQLIDAVRRVPAKAIGQALVVPFLNGFEHVDFLRSVYPPSAVVAATIRIETTKVAPGVIRHTSPFASIEMAPSPESRDRVDAMAKHMIAAGLDVRIRDDELAMLWDKFAVLGPLALLTTHERGNVGAIRAKRRDDAIDLVGEMATVAATEGVAIDKEAVLGRLDSIPDAMESSMQRDQAAGRPLELDALGGAMLRRAAKAGVAVPVTRRIVEELQSRSDQRVPTSSESKA